MTPTTVRTPADLTVIATCPTCEQPTAIRMQIGAELLVSDEGSELRLKGRSRGVAHICDQLPLDLAHDDTFGHQVVEAMVDAVAAGSDAASGLRDLAERTGTGITIEAHGRRVDVATGEILNTNDCERLVYGGDCVTHDATWPEVAKACWAVNPPPRKRAAS